MLGIKLQFPQGRATENPPCTDYANFKNTEKTDEVEHERPD